MKKIFLSILAAFAVLVSFSACQAGDTGQTPPLSEVVVGETGSEVTTNVEIEMQASETTENYDPYDYPVYPLPEGWTFEKICGLVEIDGKAIPFPCTVEEFESISNSIKVLKQDSIYIHSDIYDIYYDDVNIGTLEVDKDSQFFKNVILTFVDYDGFESISDKITFAGYTYNQVDEINFFLLNNFEISDEYYANDAVKSSFKKFMYNHDAKILDLRTHFSDSKLTTIFIQLEEDINE